MKTKKIFLLLSLLASLCHVSCEEEISNQNPYTRNTGEEFLTVDTDVLEFPGRGSSLTFTVSCSYDAAIQTPDWVTVTSLEVPGDGREFTVTATAGANKAEGGSDRSGDIVVTTKSFSETIRVSQPFYSRPDCPMTIATAEDLCNFIEVCAPYYEEGETVTFAGDIDMDGITLEGSAESFKGVLDGNGYKIRNWKTASALFATNNGVISNLVIDESCSYSVPSSDGETYNSPIVARNYGTISGCTNAAAIIASGTYAGKTYIGAMAGYHYADARITACVNKGEIRFAAQTASANAYIGGIAGYSYGAITNCETYGQINGVASSFSAVYWIGGITPRHQTGEITGNIVHNEAKIFVNDKTKDDKSYVGGIAGYFNDAPKSSDNQMYADIEVNIVSSKDMYIGGLQGFQAGVNDASNPSQNVFEGSIVNSNITAYLKGQGKNGNNPCYSAGLVTGRFSGQKGKATTLHYGTADKPIKVSGSITCLQTNTKKVASAKDYQAMLDGDGSVTSVNNGAITECDYGNILYSVCGDGQTGDAEDLIVKTDAVKLSVPSTGGEASFTVRGNYSMTVTPQVDWISSDAGTVAGDGEYHEITLTAVANDHTYTREGTVVITMPMGSTEIVTVTQEGNRTLPESLELSTSSIEADPAGVESSTFTVTSNYDAVITTDAEWIKVSPGTVEGDEAAHDVSVLCDKNNSGAERSGKLVVTMPRGKVAEIAVSQAKFEFKPKFEIGTAADFIDLMTYGGDASLYTENDVVRLTADIDLKGKSLAAVEDFVATLDGQGHSLKNWVSEAPLFTRLSGKVVNLGIDATCSTTAAVNVAYFAVNNYGTIENCVNNAAVKVTATPSASTRIAAFADYCYGTVRNCTNNGAVTFEPETTPADKALYLAGISCSVSGGVIESCTNNAEISFAPVSVTGKAYHRLGGIASICVKNKNAVIRDCVNTMYAPVTINDPSGLVTNAYAGGLVGEVEAKGASAIENCSNFGDITTNVRNDNSKIGGLLGTVGKYSATTTLLAGCSVNCAVTGVFRTSKSPEYNFLNSCGMVVGRLGGESSAVMSLGSAESPVKVSGTLNMNASEGVDARSVTISAENLLNYAVGNGSGTYATSGTTYQVVNAVFEVVTKE